VSFIENLQRSCFLLIRRFFEWLMRKLERTPTISYKDSVVTALKQEYTLLELKRDGRLFAFFDFSKARAGDTFRLRLYYFFDGWKLFQEVSVEGEQREPILSFSDRLAHGFKVTLVQTAGIKKEIPYEFVLLRW